MSDDQVNQEKMETNDQGTKRASAAGRGRPSLISPILIERLAKHLELHAPDHGDWNWSKGMKFSRCIDSMYRHLMAFHKSKSDEDHLAAIVCNAMFLMHYETHPHPTVCSLDDRQNGLFPEKVEESKCHTGCSDADFHDLRGLVNQDKDEEEKNSKPNTPIQDTVRYDPRLVADFVGVLKGPHDQRTSREDPTQEFLRQQAREFKKDCYNLVASEVKRVESELAVDDAVGMDPKTCRADVEKYHRLRRFWDRIRSLVESCEKVI